jgi:steroid 5-alpha reductase family enzyme
MGGKFMELLLTIFIWNFAAVLAMMVCGWFISVRFKNVTIVDSLWGLGFVLVVWITFAMADGFMGRKLLIAILVSLWGVRLAIYLSWRNWGIGEDPRYGSWREKSGDRFWLVSLYKVFILQSIFLWVISLVVQFGQFSMTPASFTRLDILGVAVWTAGFLFESVSDWQLTRFKADPQNKGKVMDRGLWAYSRHPNYFGEFLIWWGLFLITLSTPNSWWTVLSPVIITSVLLKMTGIPLTEKTIVNTRPGYADYIERTSAFIPWFPKKERI